MQMHIHGWLIPWWWPEGLGIASATIYLSTIKTVAACVAARPHRMRVLAFCGFLANLYGLYFGILAFFLPFALPIIPAMLFFGVLIFYPRLVAKWRGFNVYATVCVALCCLYATSELLWLLNIRLFHHQLHIP
jgi:hypothetical protein